ncbi:hypothetical protein [Candidatus Chloroploca sp. Khr17]|nr:hypothetical protein [Candidatus Chloroploca sp. Khr17]
MIGQRPPGQEGGQAGRAQGRADQRQDERNERATAGRWAHLRDG